jgi:hypothetical protein
MYMNKVGGSGPYSLKIQIQIDKSEVCMLLYDFLSLLSNVDHFNALVCYNYIIMAFNLN